MGIESNVCSVIKGIYEKLTAGTSPVVQWMRIRLPMQGARVQSLVREDPT